MEQNLFCASRGCGFWGVQYRFAKTDSYGNVLRDTQGRPYVPLLPERIARHWGYETEIKLGIQYVLFGGKQRTKIMIGDVTTSE